MRGSMISIGAVLVVAGVFAGAGPAFAQDTVFVVRHAERLDSSANSPLSADGKARAARLADLLRDAQVSAVFVTEYVRTADTGKPLADRLGLKLTILGATQLPNLVGKLRALGPKGRALVVGHSDTLPKILATLGCNETITIGADEYDNLWIVAPGATGAPSCLRLRF